MMRIRYDRPRRAMAMFALALFLAGTHYCLVGGIASLVGARVSCMAPVVASGSCHAAPGSHGGQSSPARSAPARSAPPPCCVAMAPVLATALVTIPIDVLVHGAAAPPEPAVTAPQPAAWLGFRVTRDTGP